MLEERGYEVASAENGFDALLKVKDAVIPEVIISDLNMPKCPACQWYDAASRRFQSSRAAALMEAELYRLESWPTLFMLREKIIRIRC